MSKYIKLLIDKKIKNNIIYIIDRSEEMNEVQNKKIYTLKVVLITLLVVLLVGCISFIVYDKFIKKDNKENNPQTEEKDNTANNSQTEEKDKTEKYKKCCYT